MNPRFGAPKDEIMLFWRVLAPQQAPQAQQSQHIQRAQQVRTVSKHASKQARKPFSQQVNKHLSTTRPQARQSQHGQRAQQVSTVSVHASKQAREQSSKKACKASKYNNTRNENASKQASQSASLQASKRHEQASHSCQGLVFVV